MPEHRSEFFRLSHSWIAKIQFVVLASENTELRPYLDRLSDDQTEILMGTRPYDGIATLKTERVARSWAERFSIEIEQ